MNVTVETLMGNLTNPARGYMWEVICVGGIPGGGSVRSLQLRCMTADIPGRDVGKIHVPFRQTGGFNVAGRVKYDQSLPVSFIEGEDGQVFDALLNWQELTVADKRRSRPSLGDQQGGYKREVHLRLTQAVDGQVPWRIIMLAGCFPENVAKVPVTQENSDRPLLVSATLNFDLWDWISNPNSVAVGS